MTSRTKSNTELILSAAEIKFCEQNGGKSKIIHGALQHLMNDKGCRDVTLDEMDAALAWEQAEKK